MNRKGLRLLAKGVYENTKKLGKKAGLNHLLVLTSFDIHLLQICWQEVQFIVNLNTTRIYARIPTEDILLK